MWFENVVSVANSISAEIGGEYVFCGVSALLVLLFLVRVLLFSTSMASLIMFSAAGFFLIDHPYSYLIQYASSEILIPIVWLVEISILVSVRMLGTSLIGQGGRYSKGSIIATLISLGVVSGSILEPALLDNYLPSGTQDKIFLLACAIPVFTAVGRIFTLVLPACILSGAITTALIFIVDNKDISDFTRSINISIDKADISKAVDAGTQVISMAYSSPF